MDIEQAKREFALNWGHKTYYRREDIDEYVTEALPEFLSDLNALLEQHKEVMKEELRQKLLSMRSTKEAMDKLNADDKLMQYGYHDCINEMLMWTKGIEK